MKLKLSEALSTADLGAATSRVGHLTANGQGTFPRENVCFCDVIGDVMDIIRSSVFPSVMSIRASSSLSAEGEVKSLTAQRGALPVL